MSTKSSLITFTLTVYSTNICPTFNFNLDGQEIELNAYTIFQPDLSVVDTDDASGRIKCHNRRRTARQKMIDVNMLLTTLLCFDTEGYNVVFSFERFHSLIEANNEEQLLLALKVLSLLWFLLVELTQITTRYNCMGLRWIPFR